MYFAGCFVLYKEVFLAKILPLGYKMQWKPLKRERNTDGRRIDTERDQLRGFCCNFITEELISNFK